MSDKNAFGFGAFVPGFDFLQGLVQAASKGAVGGAPAAPDWSKWVAPTLQPEEIEKRVGELKTVQFWLEQNARALAATIQALEVQKMTLATLRGMNVPVQDLASAFGFGKSPAPASPVGAGPYDDMYTRRAPEPAAPAPATAHAPAPEPVAEPEPAPSASASGASASTASASAPTPPPAVDPLQWWSALTGQFQQIAAGAMQEAAEQARRNPDLQKAARDAFDAAGRMAAGVAAAATTGSRKAAAGASKRADPARRPSAVKKTAAPAKPVATKKPAAKPAAKKAPARRSPR